MVNAPFREAENCRSEGYFNRATCPDAKLRSAVVGLAVYPGPRNDRDTQRRSTKLVTVAARAAVEALRS
jgi:hypothetical protein